MADLKISQLPAGNPAQGTDVLPIERTDGTTYQVSTASLIALVQALALKTNGTPNGSQTILNLVAGTNITLVDNGSGNVTISASGGGGSITLKTNGTNNGSQSILNLAAGSNITVADNGSGTVTISASGGGGSASFEADGDTLSGWSVTGTVTAANSTSGFSPNNFASVITAAATGGSFAHISTGLSNFAGYRVDFDISSNGSGSLVDFMFGCDVTGIGPMFRLDGRGGSNFSGIALAGSWTSPMTVVQFSFAATFNTWYAISILISTDGTKATWSVNGVVQGQGAITLGGDSIGIYGDVGSAGGNIANIRIYKP